ncbi:MAG TPA: porin [Ramlibacter sp.]|uniref:porin n=1 Tax=Ramlibacter sp. TaxID=1917967 RepID=UPI002ED50763
MKKSLIALAVMAAAGAASAQSSVTLFGTVDLTLNRTSDRATVTDTVGGTSVTARSRLTQLTNNGYNSSRLGFRGTEDLGGGMSASFWLEGDFKPDDGRAGGRTSSDNRTNNVQPNTGFNFNRRSTLSLAGGWGEVRLGRDFNPSYYNVTVFDPFGTNGAGTTLLAIGGQAVETLGGFGTSGVTFVRVSNQISYFTPANLGGFYGQASYWFGEQATPATPANREGDGNGFGLRAGYGAGPFNVALGYSRTENDVNGDFRVWNLGGSWDFGVARALFQYGNDRHDSVVAGQSDLNGKGWTLGALVPVGAGEIRASYGQYRTTESDAFGSFRDRARKIAIGYVHNLSKRTALYATAAQTRVRGTETAVGVGTVGTENGRTTAFDLGIRHAF